MLFVCDFTVKNDPQYNAEALSRVLKHKKAVMFSQRKCVLDKLPSNMSKVLVASCEFTVNESRTYIEKYVFKEIHIKQGFVLD